MNNFTVAGWSGSVVNPNYTYATGPQNGDINFDLLFTGTAANQLFILDSFTYRPDNTFFFRWEWDGTRLLPIINAIPEESYDRTPAVPEPSTICLLGFGLAGVGLFRKRFKN